MYLGSGFELDKSVDEAPVLITSVSNVSTVSLID
jgi:hypothetical protein